MKTINVKLLTVMTSMILMMGIAPAAFGQATTETHASDALPLGAQIPNTPFQFQSVNTIVGNPSGLTADIRASGIYAYYSPTATFPPFNFPVNLGAPEPDPTVLIGQRTCIDAVPDTVIGDMMWVLTHSTDPVLPGTPTLTPITAEHSNIGVLPGSTLWFDSINPSGGPVQTNPLAAPGDGFGSGQPATTGFTATSFISPVLAANEFYYWQKIDNNGMPIAGQDSTGTPGGSYFYVMCAYIDGSGGLIPNQNTSPQDDDWGGLVTNVNNGGDNSANAETVNIVVATFFIAQLVGGVQIPTSATSLLVAGAEANALWILPILGLAVTIIAIRKLEA